MAQTPADRWESGDAYEQYIGRWSAAVADQLLGWLGVAPGGVWLDVGCGTGALSRAVLANAAPTRIVGVDASAAYVDEAKRRTGETIASFQIGDARKLPFERATFDAAVSGLCINFLPLDDQPKMIAEMARVLKPGGVAALYVWDYAGEMQMLRRFWDAAAALDPAARALDEGVRFPVCDPVALNALLNLAGLNRVEARALDAPTVFQNFDDFWQPFLGRQGPAPGYVAGLSDEMRLALRERLQAMLVPIGDGPISLIARAWAVRGYVNS